MTSIPALDISQPLSRLFGIQYDENNLITATAFSIKFLIFLPIFFLLFYASRRFFHYFLKPQPATDIISKINPDFIPTFERKLSDIPDDILQKKSDAMKYYNLIPVTDETLEVFCKANRELFSSTSFQLSLEKIRERNNSLFRKNCDTSMLIESYHDGKSVIVGMSHILPLNDIGKHAYLSSSEKLKDEQIRGEHIAAHGEKSDTLILFSMGVFRSMYRDILNQPEYSISGRELATFIFIEHIRLILKGISHKNTNLGKVDILLQADKKSDKRFFKNIARIGFENTGNISGDGYPFWSKTIEFSNRKIARKPNWFHKILEAFKE